jgi:Na+-transporting NADH:ubiquinone oxidoreductase subunit C
MKKNSNKFIFIFSSVMVVIVAVLLSMASISLGPLQAKNIRIEKMQNILGSVGIKSDVSEVENLFSLYIKKQIVLNNKGEVVENELTAFDIDLKKELDKARTGKAEKQLFPLFICEKDSRLFYIIPVRGKGLWGPIWGFIALEEDLNTVYGASFGHKTETPGLGAEIETEDFQGRFKGKKILDESGNYVSVKVIKGMKAGGNDHGVDAMSGATVTSDGVSEMLQRTLAFYIPYFKTISNNNSVQLK